MYPNAILIERQASYAQHGRGSSGRRAGGTATPTGYTAQSAAPGRTLDPHTPLRELARQVPPAPWLRSSLTHKQCHTPLPARCCRPSLGAHRSLSSASLPTRAPGIVKSESDSSILLNTQTQLTCYPPNVTTLVRPEERDDTPTPPLPAGASGEMQVAVCGLRERVEEDALDAAPQVKPAGRALRTDQ